MIFNDYKKIKLPCIRYDFYIEKLYYLSIKVNKLNFCLSALGIKNYS